MCNSYWSATSDLIPRLLKWEIGCVIVVTFNLVSMISMVNL